MHILLIEPYLTGSHQNWAEEYARYSAHTVTILSLPGRFWKWRMHGGAVTLARKFLVLPTKPDLILATDMLDLATFQALTRHLSHHVPCGLYFHENQITYPWSPQDRDVVAQRNYHYGFINYTSALAADAIFFNSQYHLNAFLAALPKFLKHFPDFNELKSVDRLRPKARALFLGLDLKKFDTHRPRSSTGRPRPPLILWNHRWEYDKNPGDFFQALYTLADRGLDFEVVLLGENFRQQPSEFIAAQSKLSRHIIHAGYVSEFAEYARWLWRADILPVTSHHDFFGASVVQAIYCGCYPLLPDRLVYPDLIPDSLHASYLYRTQEELVEKLTDLVSQARLQPDHQLWHHVARFDWSTMAPIYDATFADLI